MKLETPIVALGELLWDLFPGGRRAGGAPFNFAFHCHQLGHPAVIVSRVGDDDLGRELRAEVRGLGMSDEYIQTDREHPTGTVTVDVGPDGQPAFTVAEDVAWDYLDWSDRLQRLAGAGQVVCYGTLAQRSRPSRQTIRRYLQAARATSSLVCDANLRRPFAAPEVVAAAVEQATWLKLNDDEVADVLASLGGGSAELNELGPEFEDDWAGPTRLLLEAVTNVSLVCLTRGASGCLVQTLRESVELPGIPVRVADTVGCGDAFTAALITQSLEGKSLTQSARFANAYAAVVASKPGGTPPVERAEVERLL